MIKTKHTLEDLLKVQMADNLKSALIKKGMMQKHLIEQINNRFNWKLEAPNVSRWINGVHAMPAYFLVKALIVLEMSIEEFMGHKQPKK